MATYGGLVVGWLVALMFTVWGDNVRPYAVLAMLAGGGVVGFGVGVLLRRALAARRERTDGD